MDLLIFIFNIVLYRPLFNLLILLYQYIPGRDFGIAIIVLTVSIRILLYPLGTMAIKSQKMLSEIQPKIKEVQEKYKNDKEQQTKAVMEIYQKAKINPFSGCLPILIQIPILIALYQIFSQGLKPEQMALLYSFIPLPGQITPGFLGIIDNLNEPNLLLAVLAGILQFFQSRMIMSKTKTKKKNSDFSEIFQKQMLYFFPISTVLILFYLPSAIGLYWITITLFTIIQQYFILNKNIKTA